MDTVQRVTRHNQVNQCVADEWTASMKRSKDRARQWKQISTRLAVAVIDGDVDRAVALADDVMASQ